MKKIKIYIPLLIFFFINAKPFFAQNFKFAAMSDSRGNYNGVNEPVLSELVKHMLKNNKDLKFLVFPGDLVNGNRHSADTTIKQIKHWKKIMSPVYESKTLVWPKVWVSIGNHEVQSVLDESNFKKEFQYLYKNGPNDEKELTYSFDYDNVHFVFVTTDRWHYSEEEPGKRDWHYVKHLDWLEKDLKSAKKNGVRYIFVMGHETAFPIGGHLKDALPNLGKNFKLPADKSKLWYLKQRDNFWKILSENKVSAYICGHEHIYGREMIDGVYQITAGTCGAPLYDFNPKYSKSPNKLEPGQWITYNQALPYYKVLNYNYGPGGNAQASKNFVGYRAFVYVTLHVTKNNVQVKTYGLYPKKGSRTIMQKPVKLIDSFVIDKK